MRAKEFTINVPITIKINGDEEPEIDASSDEAKPENELDVKPIMIPPLQQDLELRKAEVGKTSPVIKKLTQDEIESPDPKPINQSFNR
jgi:hypothetical protein